ncbi:hypothetical protein BSKO_12647 [Bryopsis sp. KO-2023]|nr:hypothetical protein BSKO_12647 [Bryopsis sp. KO-2023]
MIVAVAILLLTFGVSKSSAQDETGLFSLGDITSRYYSNEDIDDFTRNFVEDKQCSKISRRFSIGQSALGVDLWVLEISNNPGAEEQKPNFKYLANMHGDEINGRQLLMGLARWLCNNYPADPKAKQIVEEMHMFLLPTMNPDGFTLGQRRNANNFDLNRNFPDRVRDGLPLEASGFEQPETTAVMNWVINGSFVASANMHEGALVANYPWDLSDDGLPGYAAAPDDKTFIRISSVYASSHREMWASEEFKGGITNGNEWYGISGGMQDWNYVAAGCLEITLELSPIKSAPPSSLPKVWDDNLEAMLNYAIEATLGGLSGTVKSARGGKPLAGSITVKGIDRVVGTKGKFGDFYHPLAPGKYEVTASAEGFEDVSVEVTVPDGLGKGVVYDFEMGFSVQ